jgi:hypothetical protein
VMKLTKTLVLLAAAVIAGTVGLFWSGEITSETSPGLVSEAHAIIGRPLTPISYAGVARRSVIY